MFRRVAGVAMGILLTVAPACDWSSDLSGLYSTDTDGETDGDTDAGDSAASASGGSGNSSTPGSGGSGASDGDSSDNDETEGTTDGEDSSNSDTAASTTSQSSTTGSSDSDEDPTEETGNGGLSFAAAVWPILDNRCADGNCHQDGGGAAGLNLDEANAYQKLRLYDSIQVFGLELVDSFDADDSYLYHKLAGTHVQVGGYGNRMPPNGGALNDAELAVVAQWIDEGANP